MSEQIKDGGPAFPVLELNGQGQLELAAPGASLRDYFIAHAPAEPQPWFQPVMPEDRPNTDTNSAPEHLRADVRATVPTTTADKSAMRRWTGFALRASARLNGTRKARSGVTSNGPPLGPTPCSPPGSSNHD